MKISKSEFRQMLKECIVELVEEGKLASPYLVSPTNMVTKEEEAQTQQFSRSTPNSKLNEAVQRTAQAVAGGAKQDSKLYEQIFMDTAKTSLQERIKADNGGMYNVGMPATPQEIVADRQQLQVFDGAARWASLAFNKKS